MEIFDLVDIQRIRHPKLRKFTYESKSLKLKSRIDIFLIANEPTLPNLIHSDQTGFVKGRYIGENIRLISEIMDYTSHSNEDFRKAFDSTELPFIMKTLDHLNFGRGISVELTYSTPT